MVPVDGAIYPSSRIKQPGFWRLLPSANEVWGKVIFSQVSVCLQGGLCMMSLPVWLLGSMFLLEGSVFGPMFVPRGVSVQGGSLSREGLCPEARRLCQGDPPTETPLYGEQWAVCILLECVLVLMFPF